MVVALDQGGIKWLHGYARRSFWKVRHIYDEVDDLIQDGHVCWGIVVNKYTSVGDLTKDGRLMSLFKMTFSNHIIWTASRDKSKGDFRHLKASLDDLVAQYRPTRAQDVVSKLMQRQSFSAIGIGNDPEVFLAIAEATEPVRSVLKFLASDAGAMIMKRPLRRRLDGTREIPNARIRRHIGTGHGVDLLKVTKQYLRGASNG